MAQYQKFMFDNFVISCDENQSIAEPLSDPQSTATEILPELEPVETAAVPPQEEKLPVETFYSQEQLDAAIRSAEERGYEHGFKAAAADSDNKEQELLASLNNRLITFFADAELCRRQNEQQALAVAVAAVQKLLPTLEPQVAEAEVTAFLSLNFPAFCKEAALSFSFNPEMAALFPEVISKLADRNDFEGKIAIHKDASLGLSDCRVEWKNGGVERNSHKMLEKITDMLDDSSSENKERDNG